MMRRNVLRGRLLATAALTVGSLAAPAGAAAFQAGEAAGEASVPGVRIARDASWAADVPSLGSLVEIGRAESDLRLAVVRYAEDERALRRRYDIPYSPVLYRRQREFYEGWLRRLRELDFDALNAEGKIDYVLLRNRIEFELEMLRERERQLGEMAPLVPFARKLQELQERRRERQDVDARAAAQTLADADDEVRRLTALLRREGADAFPGITRVTASRAEDLLGALQRTLESWYTFYHGYDPLFTWWAEAPYEALKKSLDAYRAAIQDVWLRMEQEGGDLAVIGEPIGADGLRAHLAHEMIPYTPQELIAIAEAEFAWCEAEMLKASRELGFGDDWHAAIEAVKDRAVPPGRKPAVVRELEAQSVAFVEERGAITIPPLAQEIWRMEMMSPERQLINPFFLGGEVIRISYPTNGMAHDDKLMSMRGNNPHFNRATVHHELIPGHHLQGFMTRRFNAHRSIFDTPFWGEGWSLYWELVLWDQGFPRGPEDRIGMLFWRMHRAARIIFSLGFHLERMTPQEAVDFLVERVGHERANAEAEVRRSFNGSYEPLYQVGYMIGGLQFYALRRELVDSGRMSEREFHDAILMGGRMPVEMVRARLTGASLTRDYTTRWRFAGDPRARVSAAGTR
ncbi:MAG TPA: DUF885 family protein [Longimicrobiales bacterium]